MLTLYATPLSANGRKPLAVVRHLGLDVRIEHVDVYHGEGRTPAYLAINPSGKIPALVDGDFVLTESNAMIQYLAEAYGDFRLSSRDPKRRADLARWLFWEAAHWQPAWTAVVAPAVGHLLGPERIAPPDRPVRWNDATFDTTVRFLDAHLAARRWIGGDELGLADFSVAGMMTYARATGFPFPAHPHVARWYAAVESLDAWRATAAGPWTSPASPTSAPSL